ncbi:PREDICTED: translation initiation factor IF-2-like, partial [Chinchilla lanigera]|uniref:translation initiation factor IF-2-like n=1 Tax=Chinchilla lanigera TaxID=34839 RepID=UPI000698F9EC
MQRNTDLTFEQNSRKMRARALPILGEGARQSPDPSPPHPLTPAPLGNVTALAFTHSGRDRNPRQGPQQRSDKVFAPSGGIKSTASRSKSSSERPSPEINASQARLIPTQCGWASSSPRGAVLPLRSDDTQTGVKSGSQKEKGARYIHPPGGHTLQECPVAVASPASSAWPPAAGLPEAEDGARGLRAPPPPAAVRGLRRAPGLRSLPRSSGTELGPRRRRARGKESPRSAGPRAAAQTPPRKIHPPGSAAAAPRRRPQRRAAAARPPARPSPSAGRRGQDPSPSGGGGGSGGRGGGGG